MVIKKDLKFCSKCQVKELLFFAGEKTATMAVWREVCIEICNYDLKGQLTISVSHYIQLLDLEY